VQTTSPYNNATGQVVLEFDTAYPVTGASQSMALLAPDQAIAQVQAPSVTDVTEPVEPAPAPEPAVTEPEPETPTTLAAPAPEPEPEPPATVPAPEPEPDAPATVAAPAPESVTADEQRLLDLVAAVTGEHALAPEAVDLLQAALIADRAAGGAAGTPGEAVAAWMVRFAPGVVGDDGVVAGGDPANPVSVLVWDFAADGTLPEPVE